MCGICGVFNFNLGKPVERDLIANMNRMLVHRGPDDEGLLVEDNVGLGHRRLSIIDLEGGHQPMSNENKTVWIVYNGEIYNYRELREALIKSGHRFVTNSDTEVIIHLYEDYQDECVKKLNGMFAFAIWDKSRKRLLLARDRVGVKPLYYSVKDGKILFSSEVKAMLQDKSITHQIDPIALDNYLTFAYSQAPYTVLKDVSKLFPGYILTVDNGRVAQKRYWDLSFKRKPLQDFDYYVSEFYRKMKESVKRRLVSDVPLGAFLSGGMDSSTVVALMSELTASRVKTFFIGYEDQSFNESRHARLVSKHFGTDHHEMIVKYNIPDLVTRVIAAMDEPYGEPGTIPTYLASEFARHHVKVCLSGDGGDEALAGYDTYCAEKIASYCQMLAPAMMKIVERVGGLFPARQRKKGLLNMFKRFSEGIKFPSELRHMRWLLYLSTAEKQRLYSNDLQEYLKNVDVFQIAKDYFSRADGPDILSQGLYVDLKTFLGDSVLFRVDKMSMAHALEIRVPFLDYELLEFLAGIPSDLKLRGLKGKYILKKMMANRLPNSILKRAKQGFSIPMKNWITNELREMTLDAFSGSNSTVKKFFNYKEIHRLIEEHHCMKKNNSQILWSLLVLELWCRNNLR